MSDIVTFSAEIGALFKGFHSLSSLFNDMRMQEFGKLPPFSSKYDHLIGYCEACDA